MCLSRFLIHKVLVWVLALSLVAPPALWAQFGSGLQMQGPGFGIPQVGTGGIGGAVITDPRATQPLQIPFLPCPAESQAPATAAGQQAAGGQAVQPNLQALLGMAAGQQAAGGQAAQPSPQAAGGPPAGPGAAAPVQQSPQALPGMKVQTQAAQPGDPLSQIAGEMLRQVGPERIGQMLLEEEFATFLTSQGMEGQIKQFGYDFFKTPFLALSSGTDIPVGPDYILGPDDALALHIWNVPDPGLNRTFILTIERDGTVFIPQIGSIPIAGSSFAKAERLIQARLSSHLKRFDMHLSVARLRTMKVFVVGEVVRPGAYDVSSLGTVSHALYASCGPAKTGSLRRIQLVREGKLLSELDFYQFLIRGDRTQDVRLQAGDTIMVPPIGPVAGIGGAVKRPGIYEFLDRTTLADLISMAGGLHTMAARKRCQLFRIESGQRRVILDVPLEGNLPENHRKPKDSFILQDGDFVRIPTTPMQVENAVSLTGAVRDPGQYEFRPGMKLLDLLTPVQMLKDSDWEQAELIRVDPTTYEITATQFSPRAALQGKSENFELRRLDKIVVATQIKAPRTVTLKGEFVRTGLYPIESGERLSSVLKRAGGVTPRAFIPGLILTRQSIRQIQQSEMETFIAFQKRRLIGEAASLAAGAMAMAPSATAAMGGAGGNAGQSVLGLQLRALDQLAARVQPGRVVVRISSIEGLEGRSEDIVLEDGDQIAVPEYPQTISILGAVRNPTSLVYDDGLLAEDYLQKAGGITKDGNPKELYLVRADGSIETGYMKIKAVSPGDTIVVPYVTEPQILPLQLFGALAQSFGGIVSMATAALAIVVIGRNK